MFSLTGEDANNEQNNDDLSAASSANNAVPDVLSVIPFSYLVDVALRTGKITKEYWTLRFPADPRDRVPREELCQIAIETAARTFLKEPEKAGELRIQIVENLPTIERWSADEVPTTQIIDSLNKALDLFKSFFVVGASYIWGLDIAAVLEIIRLLHGRDISKAEDLIMGLYYYHRDTERSSGRLARTLINAVKIRSNPQDGEPAEPSDDSDEITEQDETAGNRELVNRKGVEFFSALQKRVKFAQGFVRHGTYIHMESHLTVMRFDSETFISDARLFPYPWQAENLMTSFVRQIPDSWVDVEELRNAANLLIAFLNLDVFAGALEHKNQSVVLNNVARIRSNQQNEDGTIE